MFRRFYRNLKKRQQKEALLAEQKLKEEKEKEQQKQQMIREKKLIEWLNRKKQEKNLSRNENPTPDEKTIKTTFLTETRADQIKLNFDAWKMKKMEKEKARKIREERQVRLNEKLKEAQRSLSVLKHEMWLRTAHEKPRPVPLNQGLLSIFP